MISRYQLGIPWHHRLSVCPFGESIGWAHNCGAREPGTNELDQQPNLMLHAILPMMHDA